MWSILTDDRIDFVPIFYWIGSVADDHIWVFTRCMDMYMAIAEDSLQDSCDLSVDLLDSIESTLADSSRERWYLLDTDDPLIRDDEEIKLVVDPWEEYEREKKYPIQAQSTPK